MKESRKERKARKFKKARKACPMLSVEKRRERECMRDLLIKAGADAEYFQIENMRIRKHDDAVLMVDDKNELAVIYIWEEEDFEEHEYEEAVSRYGTVLA